MTAAEFDGKTVYVVGGSMGIGLAAANQCAHLGADVLLFARRRAPLETAASPIPMDPPATTRRTGGARRQ